MCLALSAAVVFSAAQAESQGLGRDSVARSSAEAGATAGLAALETPGDTSLLVYFFATWCEPCQVGLPALDRLKNDLARDGIDVVAVSVGEPLDRVRRYFGKHPVGYSIALDQDRAAAKAWGVAVLPSAFVVDPSRKSRQSFTADHDWDSSEARAALRIALQSRTPPAHQQSQSHTERDGARK